MLLATGQVLVGDMEEADLLGSLHVPRNSSQYSGGHFVCTCTGIKITIFALVPSAIWFFFCLINPGLLSELSSKINHIHTQTLAFIT